jgi:Nucleotide modification associated domain 2
MNIYFYKLTTDNGGAPCVQYGLLSLAICKPMIRKAAAEGDLIFGFAANSLHPDNRLIYIARVTKKLCCGEYYKRNRYSRRRDCIYSLSRTRFVWKRKAAYHEPQAVTHDLGTHPEYARADVLLSRDFRYFGAAGTDEYKAKFPRVARAVEHWAKALGFGTGKSCGMNWKKWRIRCGDLQIARF